MRLYVMLIELRLLLLLLLSRVGQWVKRFLHQWLLSLHLFMLYSYHVNLSRMLSSKSSVVFLLPFIHSQGPSSSLHFQVVVVEISVLNSEPQSASFNYFPVLPISIHIYMQIHKHFNGKSPRS